MLIFGLWSGQSFGFCAPAFPPTIFGTDTVHAGYLHDGGCLEIIEALAAK
jgi:hypothetical protein